jgi:hypothetical protein
MVCEVCKLLDNDLREKACQFCARCQAWICSECWNNYLRRAKAMLLRQMGVSA